MRQHVRAIRTTYARPEEAQVTKDLVEILRATVYSITDRDCFAEPPKEEKDVHVRIEAVLRCVFPTLRTKPAISKPIKNFVPDTGLPEVNTLIEYKFAETNDDVKRIADEVLADTRGYSSREWTKFIYVIYETRRLKSEKLWRDLLRESGVPGNTEIIVVSGEVPDAHSAPVRAVALKKRRTR